MLFSVLFSGDNLVEWLLHFRKSNPHVLFTRKSLPFHVLTSTRIESTCSHKMLLQTTREQPGYADTLPFGMAPKPIKICCAEGMLLNLGFLKLNVVICVLIDICTCSVKVQ